MLFQYISRTVNSSDLEKLVFETLGIDRKDQNRADFLSLGYIQPIGNHTVVDALTKHRAKVIHHLYANVHSLLPSEAEQALRAHRLVSHEVFCLQAKNALPTRSTTQEGGYEYPAILPDATWEAYLAYVEKTDPPLHRFFLSTLAIGFCLRFLSRHAVIVGQSGSGKSELLVTLNEQMYQARHRTKQAGKPTHTQIIVDPHSDFASQFARLKYFAANEDDLIYINPFADPKQHAFVAINPFEQIDTREAAVTAKVEGLLIAFQSIFGDDFSLNMNTLIKYCLWVLLLKPDTDIHDLLRFMDETKNSDLIEFGQTRLPNAVLRNFFNSKFQNKRLDITKEAVSNKLYALLSSTNFQRFFRKGANSLDLQALMDSRKVVVIDLNFGQMGEETGIAIGSFLFGLFYYEALRRAELHESQRIPVYLTIDEYQNFIARSKNTFEKILTQARKYKLALILAQQHLAQGDRDFLNTIRTGTAVKIAGYTSDSEANARLVNQKLEALDDLHQGEFMVKVGRNPTFRMIASDRLIQKPNHPAYMTPKEWQTVLRKQLEEHYNYSDQAIDKRSQGTLQETIKQQGKAPTFKGKKTARFDL